MSEPGMKFDSGKLRYFLLDPAAMAWTTAVLTYGAVLYAAGNWRIVEDREERYYDGLIRHVEAWRAGERYDPDTGMPHLAHMMCNAMFLLGTTESDTTRLPELLHNALQKARKIRAERLASASQPAS